MLVAKFLESLSHPLLSVMKLDGVQCIWGLTAI